MDYKIMVDKMFGKQINSVVLEYDNLRSAEIAYKKLVEAKQHYQCMYIVIVKLY